MKFTKLCALGVSILISISALSSLALATEYTEPTESDKLYMQGDIEVEDPITVVLQEPRMRSVVVDDVLSSDLSFETSIYKEDAIQVEEANKVAVEETLSNRQKRTLFIDIQLSEFLKNYSNTLANTFVDENVPNIAQYFDLSKEVRQQNKFIVENFYYNEALIKQNDILSCSNELAIKNVSTVGLGISKVEFTTVSMFATTDGEEGLGLTHIAYVARTNSGYKILKHTVLSPDFTSMQIEVVNEVAESELSKSSEWFADQLLTDIEVAKDRELNLVEEVQDPKPPSLTRARTTIYYDRSAVASAAKKYAYTTNPIFYRASLDCTNYVSQSIWQSPGWKFDTIGKNDSVKWACVKNYQGKYERSTASWAGVNALYEYLKTNDSVNYAGTVYGISGSTSGYSISNIQLGDVIQFYNSDYGDWRHSVIVSELPSYGIAQTMANVRVAAHENSADRKPVSEYWSRSNVTKYRIIHINNFITSY